MLGGLELGCIQGPILVAGDLSVSAGGAYRAEPPEVRSGRPFLIAAGRDRDDALQGAEALLAAACARGAVLAWMTSVIPLLLLLLATA